MGGRKNQSAYVFSGGTGGTVGLAPRARLRLGQGRTVWHAGCSCYMKFRKTRSFTGLCRAQHSGPSHIKQQSVYDCVIYMGGVDWRIFPWPRKSEIQCSAG
jgi:hypothetical protein